MSDETANRVPPPRRFTSGKRQTLALGGIAAAASLGLAGCGSSEPEFADAQFTSVPECVKAGFPDELCQQSYSAALQEQQKDAPKFNTLESCQKEWGQSNCGPVYNYNTGSSVFMPLLAGFVVGQLMQRDYWRDGYVNYYGGSYYGKPIYRNRSGSTVTWNRGSGSVAKMTPVNVNTKSVAAKGFGAMGMSRSSSGFSFGG